MPVIGLDIGGANLKGATSDGAAHSEPFELWRAPEQLGDRLLSLLERFPRPDALAVTMTAELADCFETKAEGVDFILREVERAARGTMVRVWPTSGRFVTVAQARQSPRETAAANWHALATWAGRLAPEGNALLVDIGSTTTDIIPLRDGKPCPFGQTDVERLKSGELVYTGVRRTPLCAVAPVISFRDTACSVAAELFATTLDVYLLLGEIAEDVSDCHTANGRPATKSAAHDRLARMLCCDREEFTGADAESAARSLAETQQSQLLAAMEKVLVLQKSPCATVVVSGSGTFLAKRLVAAHSRTQTSRVIAIADQLSPELADAACAYAVAVLAVECS